MHNKIPGSAHPFPYAMQVQREASHLGFDWQEITGVLDKIEEELTELRDALEQGDPIHAQSELGDLLFAAISAARFLNTDPETCLKKATERFEYRLKLVKINAENQGISLAGCTPDELDILWEEAKKLMSQQLKNGLDN
ncbi:MAG: nucleotide pyrophosphohydrolase [Candidatus Hydrogenedentes bacterium]|nr:nucleotide pyrophosphohydrolase [Candidatus Hydrogenedentota bacterium]